MSRVCGARLGPARPGHRQLCQQGDAGRQLHGGPGDRGHGVMEATNQRTVFHTVDQLESSISSIIILTGAIDCLHALFGCVPISCHYLETLCYNYCMKTAQSVSSTPQYYIRDINTLEQWVEVVMKQK